MPESLPNVITLLRLISVPLIVWLIVNGFYGAAFWLFVAAGVSDAVDGFLAKRFDLRTLLGAYLDPVADKALLVSIYVALGFLAHLPSWLVILVVSRDVLIVGAVVLSWIVGYRIVMAPTMTSKANTTLQIALAALVLASLGLGFDAAGAIVIGGVLTGLTTVASGAIYMIDWVRGLQSWEVPRQPPAAEIEKDVAP